MPPAFYMRNPVIGVCGEQAFRAPPVAVHNQVVGTDGRVALWVCGSPVSLLPHGKCEWRDTHGGLYLTHRLEQLLEFLLELDPPPRPFLLLVLPGLPAESVFGACGAGEDALEEIGLRESWGSHVARVPSERAGREMEGVGGRDGNNGASRVGL